MAYQASEPSNMLNLSRSMSRDQWSRRNASLLRMASVEIGQLGVGQQASRKWRSYRVARWLQVAIWMLITAPTWMLGWNMIWLTGMDLVGVDYVSVSEHQVEDIHSAQLRKMDENHPDLPDPEEPTTNSDWSELVKIEPWQSASRQSSAVPEMGV